MLNPDDNFGIGILHSLSEQLFRIPMLCLLSFWKEPWKYKI